jgi:RND superfamily putative drug exporter
MTEDEGDDAGKPGSRAQEGFRSRPERSPLRPPKLRLLVPALLVVAWLAVGGIGGPFAGKLSSVASNDSASFLPSSAESTRVQAEQRAFSTSQDLPAVIIAARDGGITPADRDFLAAALRRIQQLPHVDARSVSPPIPSKDGQALQAFVPISDSAAAGDAVDAMRHDLTGAPAGLTVLVTGPAGLIADLMTAFAGIDGLLLLVAAGVVVLILVVVYRSVLLPLIVLLSAVFALGLASLAVYVLADTDVLTLNGQSQGILFILVFGAATDYALLLVSRFREQLRDTPDRVAAMRLAWRATLEPIAASAGTVILGVLCLLFSDLNSNRSLGPVAAIGIAAAFLASMTFLPAILALIGRNAFWPLRPAHGSQHPETRGWWASLAARIAHRPRTVWIVTGIALLIFAAFLPQLRAQGTSQSATFLRPVDAVAGQNLLAEHFPGGSGNPTVIIANADAAPQVQAAAKIPGVAQVSTLTGRDGKPTVVDGRTEIQAVLTAPADSEQAVTTVARLRTAVHAVPGANALVGGQTAIQLDTQQTSERDRTVIIPIVLLVIFLILALLLRALIAPLVLIATVVLSFAATMGITALVFNHLFHFPGADPSVSLFGFVFLVALGIDYNIFLMTRVREETIRSGTRDGTRRALALTGGVITSAGVVLAATFAALAVIPLLFLAQIAFIVAFGVLLDTLVVRTLLVPAAVIDLDRRTWWPSRLMRAGPQPGERATPAQRVS